MTGTAIHRAFAPFNRLPSWISNPIRSTATAVLGPLMFGYRTGFFRSCFRMAAVARDGEPIPWYTYPSIDFLKYRSFAGRDVLEFGSGQSTLWWAQRARGVLSFEGDPAWCERIRPKMPANVDLRLVSMANPETNVSHVRAVLAGRPHDRYDVIVIDRMFRPNMVDIACEYLEPGGIIIADNSEGYGIWEEFVGRGFSRVDFYGNAPGVVLPHCTSIYFRGSAFVFDHDAPMHVIFKE